MASPPVERSWRPTLDHTFAAEIMQVSPPTVRADTRVSDIRRLLDRRNSSVVMVLDGRDRALGWVRRGDITPRSISGYGGRLDDGTSRWFDVDAARTEYALDVFVPLVAYIYRDATLGDAVRLMCKEELGYLPVLDRTYRLQGLLETRNVLAWVARQAGYVVSS